MKNKKGLTLVEVVIALAVFMIAVVMAYPIITYAGKSNLHTQKKMELQEMGNYVAENIAYVALESLDQTAFKSRLSSSGLCVIEEQPCTNLMDLDFKVDNFSRVSDLVYQSSAKDGKVSITLTFNDKNNNVHILLTLDEVKYEIVEYLRYGK